MRPTGFRLSSSRSFAKGSTSILELVFDPIQSRQPGRYQVGLVAVAIESGDPAVKAFIVVAPGNALAGSEGVQRLLLVVNPPVIVATVDAPARALECAYRLSEILRRNEASHRISIHAGEIDQGVDGTLDGIAMRVAADIVEHVHSNAVLVSRTVSDLVAGSPAELEDSGTFHLPSIAQNWRLYRLFAA